MRPQIIPTGLDDRSSENTNKTQGSVASKTQLEEKKPLEET